MMECEKRFSFSHRLLTFKYPIQRGGSWFFVPFLPDHEHFERCKLLFYLGNLLPDGLKKGRDLFTSIINEGLLFTVAIGTQGYFRRRDELRI